jgi:hypothetical protein
VDLVLLLVGSHVVVLFGRIVVGSGVTLAWIHGHFCFEGFSFL